MCRFLLLLFLFGLSGTGGQIATAQPVVPGFDVSEYASVTDPMRIGFDSSGVLFAGRDNSGSGGGFDDPVKIHRVGVGGLPVTEYGDSTIADPDAVVVDTTGFFGTPGAVIIGGQISNTDGGQIVSILPNENIVVLFGPTTGFHNPTDIVFDNQGRMLFTNAANPGLSPAGVYVTSGPGDIPTALFTTSAAAIGIAIGSMDRIFVSTSDGRIEVHESDGTLIDDSFVTDLGGGTLLAFGDLGTNDTRLFTINSSGDMLRIDELGNICVVGNGLDPSGDIVFGPDGALYVAEFNNDRILRITQSDFVLGDLNGDNAVNLLDVAPFVQAIATGTFIPEADINGDGAVDLLDVQPFIDLLSCG